MHKLDGEYEILRTNPHLLAFLPQYSVWLSLLALGALAVWARAPFVQAMQGGDGLAAAHGPLTDVPPDALVLFGWILAVLVPTLVLAAVRFNARPLLRMVLLALGATAVYAAREWIALGFNALGEVGALAWWYDLVGEPNLVPENALGVATLIFGGAGFVAAELRRAGHKYILTNKRFVARLGWFAKHERDVMYDRIDDLVIYQTVIGRLFNFGSVVPLTHHQGTVMLAGDGHRKRRTETIRLKIRNGETVEVPRESSFYVLYGVPSPGAKKDVILQEINKRRAGRTTIADASHDAR